MKIGSPIAFGFRDLEGVSTLAQGETVEPGSAAFSVSFRDFHYPRVRKSGEWRDFPQSAEWRLRDIFTGNIPSPQLNALSLGQAEEKPPRGDWDKFCEKIDRHLESGTLQKAVPARSRIVSLDQATAGRLKAEIVPRLFSGPSGGAFRFFLKSGESWFFGATPEMLFRREGENILVPAIAGTRAIIPGADVAALKAELLADRKERNEHALVVEGIRAKLSSLGLKCSAPAEPSVMQLRSLIHLYTPVTAVGKVSPGDLMLLHPTAAVGGSPQRQAQEFLHAEEPLERGLFAGPLLFRFPGLEICLVAIRSALLEENRLRFFAGAGFVNGSRSEAEWAETGKKMDSLQLLLEEERA